MRVPGMFLAVVAVLAGLCGPAQAKPPVDGPGRYYVFRTLDSGQDPTAEQNGRCDAHFGPRAPLAAVRLNARLYSFRIDRLTSRLAGQTASVLGPGFICGTATAGGDPFDAFAYTTLPGVGSSDASGTCALEPVTAQAGSLFLGCRLGLAPDPAQGLVGGLVTSNSIVNPGNAVPGSPTGSVWTAYVVRRPGAKAPATAAPPAGPPPPSDVPGADFYVARAVDDAAPAPGAACPGQGATGARTARLRSVQPSLRSSAIEPGAEYTTTGALTVCYLDPSGADGHRATARVSLGSPRAPLVVTADGQCRDLPTPAGQSLRQQNCVLNVPPGQGGIRGGVVTSNGLVPAGATNLAANSAVWTVSLFGGRVSPAPANAHPRVRVVVRRAGARLARVRWASAGAARSRRFDVQVLRAGARRWRALRRATARLSVRLRLRRGVRYRFRVRGRDEDGLAGPWKRSRRVVLRAGR